MQTIGACSICGGAVVVPTVWSGVIPPVPRCQACGATAEPRHGPVIPMVPATPGPAAERVGLFRGRVLTHADFDEPVFLEAPAGGVDLPATDRELLGRALKSLRPPQGCTRIRWALVRDALQVGSTSAGRVCQVLGLDPDEVIRG